jgi:hypothetical protein
MSGDPEVDGAYVHWLQLCTRGLLSRPDNWAAVTALAAALLEHREIGGRRTREIIRGAMREWIERKLASPRSPAGTGV